MIHVREAEHLLKISARQRRRSDAEVINRAAVVFLVAVWQTYVEALSDELCALVGGSAAKAAPNRLNTPNSKNVDALFERLFCLKAVSNSWTWRGMTSGRARSELDSILALRHQIAHKARVRGTVTRSAVLKYVHFVHRLAISLYNHTARYAATLFGKPVPRKIMYGGTIGQFSR